VGAAIGRGLNGGSHGVDVDAADGGTGGVASLVAGTAVDRLRGAVAAERRRCRARGHAGQAVTAIEAGRDGDIVPATGVGGRGTAANNPRRGLVDVDAASCHGAGVAGHGAACTTRALVGALTDSLRLAVVSVPSPY